METTTIEQPTVNAQGSQIEVLKSAPVLDLPPVILKADAAIKADRTEDSELLKEARIDLLANLQEAPSAGLADPVSLKLNSAIKRSIADRTGNMKLLEEARFEQSLADRLGARSALLNKEVSDEKPGLLPTPASHATSKLLTELGAPADAIALKMDAAIKQSIADRTGNDELRKLARAEQSLADRLGGRQALARSVSANHVPADQAKTSDDDFSKKLLSSASSDHIALKLDAAMKRSIADRTGDIALKKEAQLAQSIADKAGARQAMLHLANVAKQQGRAYVAQLNTVEPKPATLGDSAEKRPRKGKNEPQGPSTPDASLKLDAAVKRSIADRTGDLALKKEAQLAQSLADRSGARKALLARGKIAKQQGRAFVKQQSEESGATTTLSEKIEPKVDLEGRPQTIACLGCGQEYQLSAAATGPSLSTHLRDFPDHRKAIAEVPEKDRVYVDKANYKGSFDHNFADPLNFAPETKSALPAPASVAASASQ